MRTRLASVIALGTALALVLDAVSAVAEIAEAPPDQPREAAADSVPPAREPSIIVYERDPRDRSSEEEIEDRLFVDESEVQVLLEDREGKRLGLGLEAQYDRVHELAVTLSQSIEDTRRLSPRLHLRETFSTGLEHWYYRADFDQPLSRKHRLSIGASAFRETAVFTDLVGRVGDAENTLASLFFREDFRHYYGREGVEVRASAGVSRRPQATVRYTDATHDPLAVTTNGSVFRPRDSFRDNPRATEGRLRAFALDLEYDSGHDRRGRGLGHHHVVTYETSTKGLGSDFDYRRWVGQSVLELPLGPLQEFRARFRTGGVVNGDLPAQSLFYLGGIGTLHAQDYATIVGERCYLVNLEYAFNVFWQVQAIVFQDLGAAWSRPTKVSSVRPALDAGLALGNRTGRFRLNIARDLRAEHAPLVATVRLSRPF